MKSFKDNLEKVKEIANNFSDNIIFIGLTKVDESKVMPIPWSVTKYYDNENVKIYDQIIKDFCEESNIYFIEMFDLLDNENLPDGLHPDSEGHKKMFERVRDFLVENEIIK